MRLIDADALKDNCFIYDGDDLVGRREYVMFHEIDDAPTIDPNELELDIDYSIEYDKRPDGISNAKVTITRIKPSKSTDQNVADVPSGDPISRADAIEECYRKAKEQHNILYPEDVDDILSFLPSADAVQGEWGGNHALGWKCSKCGFITNLASNFCPHCGADMRNRHRNIFR